MTDDLNVPVGSLEPFLNVNSEHYVGHLLAYHFRRGANRVAAVNYGTAHSVSTPVSSATTEELGVLYHELKQAAKRDERSEELYEEMVVLRLEVGSWEQQLVAGVGEEERDNLLIEIDKALVRMEEIAEEMERLADA